MFNGLFSARKLTRKEFLGETTQAMDAARKKNGTKGSARMPKTDPDSRIVPNQEGGFAANYGFVVTTGAIAPTAHSANSYVGR